MNAVTFAGPGSGLVRFRLGPRRGESGAVAFTGEVEVFVRTAGAEFTSVREVAVFLEDVRRFRDALVDLLESGAAGTARLEPMTDFHLHVSFADGEGTLSGFVEDVASGARLAFGGLATDPSYLAHSLRELDALLESAAR